MSIGRNASCPCGSGKKYKHCCLRAENALVETPQELLRRRIRALTEGLSEQLLRFVFAKLDRGLIDEAWTDFTLGEEDAFTAETPHTPVFLPWFFHQWLPDPEATSLPAFAARETTVAGEFLAQRRRSLDPLLARYLDACAAARFSFHEVARVEPGRGFLLRDVMLERETFVTEHTGSQNARQGDLVFAQIVTIDELALIEGWGTVVIQPGDKPAIIDLRKSMRNESDLTGTALLKDWESDLIELYLELAERILHPRLPELQNTDGEPLTPHKLVFGIADAAAAATAFDTAQLDAGESIESDGEHQFRDGALHRADWTWMRAGNAMHESWDNTTLGQLELKQGQLRVSVNSRARADRARSLVERLLGDNAEYRVTKVESAETLLKQAMASPAPPDRSEHERLMQSPEVREQVKKMLWGHYTGWLDSPLPILGNRSPREAVRDADGRESVEALIAQMERDAQLKSPALDAEITQMLRRELDLSTDS